MVIRGQAWKVTHEKNAPECIYRLQVSGIKGVREEARIEKALPNWSWSGDGYNNKTQESTLFFNRDFVSVDKFVAWGKSFSEFPLVELDKDGEVKKYVKIGPRGSNSTSKRICGKCGIAGHNARTCITSKAVKDKKSGTRKCGKCGNVGHNARTCKNGFSDKVLKKALNDLTLTPVTKGNGCADCRFTGLNCETCGILKGTRKLTVAQALEIYNAKNNVGTSIGKPADVNAGKYKCGGCGEQGHNKRTCPNK